MLTRHNYKIREMLRWTRRETLVFAVIAISVCTLHAIAGFSFLQVPWAPVAAIGTAVAFIVGFQNNAAYGRIWEARKIWGGIINVSRSFAMQVVDMVSNEHAAEPVSDEELAEIKQTIIYRHIGWLTALRHAMRQPRSWEILQLDQTNQEWIKELHIPETIFTVEDELFHHLSDTEWHIVTARTNKQAAVLFLQSNHLRELKERGLIWEFAFLEMENSLKEMFDLQGKSERIKNFPYPRQYSTLSHWFVWIFVGLLPLAVIPEFAKVGRQLAESTPLIGDYFVWASVPFCILISWIFHTMERIGRSGENPFEGSMNDVPISTISRGIEIDLHELLGEDKDMIPKPLPEVYNVQM